MTCLEVLEKIPEASSKTPILLVHGAWHGAWCWESFLPYFAEHGHPTYALSLRGHGASEIRGRLYWARLADYVDDVARVAADVCAAHGRRPIVVGHSMGGRVTQLYLEQHEAPAAVLLAPVPATGTGGFLWRSFRKHPMRMSWVLGTGLSRVLIDTPARAKELLFSNDYPDDRLNAHWSRLGSESAMASLEMLRKHTPSRGKQTPTLLLAAKRDAIFTVSEEEAAASALGTNAIVFDMAHDMMLESDWRSVADHIVDWVAGIGA